MMRGPERALINGLLVFVQETGCSVNLCGLQYLLIRERREKPRQSLGQHGLPRAGRSC